MKDERVTQACWLVLTTRARPPVRSEVGLPRHAHIAKGAMYAPPEAGFGCASAPNRWERSRNVAWNQRFHKLRSHRGLVGPHERDAPPSDSVQRRDWVAPTWRC